MRFAVFVKRIDRVTVGNLDTIAAPMLEITVVSDRISLQVGLGVEI